MQPWELFAMLFFSAYRPALFYMICILHETDQAALVAASDYEPALNIPANFIGLFKMYAGETQPYF